MYDTEHDNQHERILYNEGIIMNQARRYAEVAW
jgi:hypothetical protein